jgi:hypothetical protein
MPLTRLACEALATALSLLSKRREILLSTLKSRYFLACGTLPVHSKPKDRDNNACNACGDILSNLTGP